MICALSILRFPYFHKELSFAYLSVCWVLHTLSIIHVKHLLSATRRRPALRITEFQSRNSLSPWQQKLLHSIGRKEYQLRFASNKGLTTRTHFFTIRMALERGQSTKDTVNKSCWWSMGVAVTRVFDAITLQRYTLYQCKKNMVPFCVDGHKCSNQLFWCDPQSPPTR